MKKTENQVCFCLVTQFQYLKSQNRTTSTGYRGKSAMQTGSLPPPHSLQAS